MRRLLMLVLLLLAAMPLAAQEALNLPADLYVLLNSGVVKRYGLGTEGVTDVTPADVFVIDFGVSPDTRQIAYRTESNISILSFSEPENTRVIERQADVPPYRGRGETIAWSPDQRAIAYTTTYGVRVFHDLGDVAAYSDLREGLFVDLLWSPDSRFLAGETDGGVWWIYRRDESTMSLASVIPASDGVAWVTGGQIVFTPPEGGVLLMDLDRANAQSIILDAQWEYHLPYLNSSDELVFFGRDTADDTTPTGYGRLQSIARGAAQIVTRSSVPVRTQGLRWTPGAALLTAFDGGRLALFDPVSGQGFPLPISDIVAYGWGVFDAQAFFAVQPTPQSIVDVEPTAVSEPGPSIELVSGVPLTYEAFFLAADEAGAPQVWRLPINGGSALAVTFAAGGVSEFAVAPDLRSLAYVSDRQLWLQLLAGGRPLALANLESVGFVSPTFSPDSQEIAYADGGIRLVSVNAGDARVVRADVLDERIYYGEPKFSVDGKRLLISELMPGINGVHGVLSLEDGSYTLLETDFGARALWLSDGSIVSYGYTLQGSTPEEQWVVRFSPATYTTADTIYVLPSAAKIETVVEGVLGEVRLIVRQGETAPPEMIDVAYANGEQATITALPAIVAPRLSFDGVFVAGYLSLAEINGVAQGPLTIFNAQTGVQVLLTRPASAWSFQWSR
jgi:hypothetical protein